MTKVTSFHKARKAKEEKARKAPDSDGFDPCSQDMTICCDCDGNRAKNKCPRLKEWLARKG